MSAGRRSALVLLLAVLAAACSSGTPAPTSQVDSKGALRPEDPDGNVVLYVSNQSHALSPVDITVALDGEEILSADFRTVEAHDWVEYHFDWKPGGHTVNAVSKTGDATTEVPIEIHGKTWIFVGYWFDPVREPEKKFTILVQDEPFGPG